MKLVEVKVRRSERPQKTRIFIFEKGEGILENLMKRHSRPYEEYKKEVLPLVKAWLAANRPDVNELEIGRHVGWSQKAGCSCGCSPGFIVDYFGCRDIYVTISN